jgi:hypothetical protein
MSGTLVVETEEFARAASAAHQDCAEPISRALGMLMSSLEGCGSMAGSDPGGRDWASSYDRAARAAATAQVDSVNGGYRLALLFAQSARNYEHADIASSASPADRHAVNAMAASLPGPASLSYTPSLPTASGGSGGGPTGWGLVQQAVGYAWPNGHQDRLRHAADAWSASARVIDDAALNANMASVGFGLARLPEHDDMVTVCCAMCAHLQELAAVQRSLANACEELAHHIDQVHSDIENELGGLVWQSAVVEGAGLALSFVTLGTAEVPTQGVEASRVASIARRIKELIEAFIAATRALAASVAGLADRAVHVTAKLKAILDLKVAAATVMLSRRYPLVGHVAERFAAARLALGFRGGVLVHLENPKLFDPHILEGMSMARIRASIPKTWERRPSKSGDGLVFGDPTNKGRYIRIMPGYERGTRADPRTFGPYAVVAQNGIKVKIPLAGSRALK